VSRKTKSRWAARPLNGRPAKVLRHDHPAVVAGRTIYPSTVYAPTRDANGLWVLKSAANNGKIGGEILKGRWRGLPAYTLTLEERATCPTTCRHWRSCYGNKMHWAQRWQAGPDLEWRLEREVALLDCDHPDGFAVRLHELGDFYSVEYVELWGKLLERHPGLHIWGYTAHLDGPIAAALGTLIERYGDRFAMRFSNAPFPFPYPTTITVETAAKKPADAILCPEQVGKTESCSTCGLCWQTDKRIAFIQHWKRYYPA
jgi:hypothetical protein